MNRRSTYVKPTPESTWFDVALGGALGMLVLVVCIGVAATIARGLVS